MLTLKQP